MRVWAYAALAGLGLAAPAEAERFTSAVTGISIDKPDHWRILTVEVIGGDESRPEPGTAAFDEYVRKHATVPIFGFIRFAEPFPNINPSVKVLTRPVGSFDGQAGELVLAAMVPSLKAAMGDLTIETAPEAVILGGQPAGHMKLSYVLHSAGAAYPAMSEMWIVPRGSYLVMVAAGYRPAASMGDAEEVHKIVQSIEFAD